jgi:F420-non-reducing hydrogenase iron-sulfur subunit
LRAQQRVNYVCNLLEQIGLEGERVRMVNLSAAMGARFAEITTEMVEKIRALGQNPLGQGIRESGIRESGNGKTDFLTS